MIRQENALSKSDVIGTMFGLGKLRTYMTGIACVVLALCIFILDTLSSVHFAVAVSYVIVIVWAATYFEQRVILATAIACALLTILSFAIEHGINSEKSAILRAIVSLSAIGTITLLVLMKLSADARLRASERKRINLSRFFSPQMIDQLVEIDVPLSIARRLSAVIMFVDIVGFTDYSSKRSPEEIITMLRELLAILSNTIFSHYGIVDKFLGDGVLAIFGAPAHNQKDATNATMCAHSMLRAVARWNEMRCQLGEEPIRLAIGMHKGEVVLGDVGSDAQLELTVFGDAVNIASRVEAYCRALDTALLVTSPLIDSLRIEGSSDIAETFIDRGWHILRGRNDPIRLYSIKKEAQGGALAAQEVAVSCPRVVAR
jgi:class 3 adenylate cyclase